MAGMAGMPGMPGMGNMFGGGVPPSSGNMFSAPAAPAATAPVVVRTGHEALTFRVLPVRTKQATLYSSSSSVVKIFLKLAQLIQAQDSAFLSPETKQLLLALQNCLENRKEVPLFQIPTGSFRLIGALPARST